MSCSRHMSESGTIYCDFSVLEFFQNSRQQLVSRHKPMSYREFSGDVMSRHLVSCERQGRLFI